MMKKRGEAGRSRFGQGIDFMLTFRDKPFTVREIAQRYKCTDKEARTLINIVEAQVQIEVIGFALPTGSRGPYPNLLRMKLTD